MACAVEVLVRNLLCIYVCVHALHQFSCIYINLSCFLFVCLFVLNCSLPFEQEINPEKEPPKKERCPDLLPGNYQAPFPHLHVV